MINFIEALAEHISCLFPIFIHLVTEELKVARDAVVTGIVFHYSKEMHTYIDSLTSASPFCFDRKKKANQLRTTNVKTRQSS